MDTEEVVKEHDLRLRELEVHCATLDQKVDENLTSDDTFRRDILLALDKMGTDVRELKEQFAPILQKEKDKAELILALKEKLITSGAWAAIVFLGYVAWYAFTNFIRNGGH